MTSVWEAMARAQKEDGVSGYDLVNKEDFSETDFSENSEEFEATTD